MTIQVYRFECRVARYLTSSCVMHLCHTFEVEIWHDIGPSSYRSFAVHRCAWCTLLQGIDISILVHRRVHESTFRCTCVCVSVCECTSVYMSVHCVHECMSVHYRCLKKMVLYHATSVKVGSSNGN